MLEGESRNAKAEKRKPKSESWKAKAGKQMLTLKPMQFSGINLSPEEEESPCRKGRSSILVSMALWPHPDPSRTRA